MELIAEGIGNGDSSAYASLLDNDQLTSALATSASFPGFQELTLPKFAPTYKKKVLSLFKIVIGRSWREIMNVTIHPSSLSASATTTS